MPVYGFVYFLTAWRMHVICMRAIFHAGTLYHRFQLIENRALFATISLLDSTKSGKFILIENQ